MFQKHLFVGSENRSALITQFQPFAAAGSDGFLGNIQGGARPTTTSVSVIAMLRQLTEGNLHGQFRIV
jgi:hypothetical protein